MLSFLLPTITLVSLIGIFFGALLKSKRVRDLIELTYIQASDLTSGQLPRKYVLELTDAFLGATVLDKKGKISPRKIAVLSFLSCTMFLMSFTSNFWAPIEQDSFIAEYVGSGLLGGVLAKIALYCIVWPSHFIFDFISSSMLLYVWRRVSDKSIFIKFICVMFSFVAFMVIVFAICFGLYINTFGLGYVDPKIYTLKQLIIFAPIVLNGPVFLGLDMLITMLAGSGVLSPFQLVLLISSCSLTFCVFIVIMFARVLTLNKSILEKLSQMSLAISEIDADKLYHYSCAIFTIGGGLCSLFGVTIKN